MSVADINSKVAEAIAANESGDYATALTKLRSAQMLLAATPNATGHDGVGLQWDRQAIASMIAEVSRQASASGGIQRTRVTYRRVGSVPDCW
jgi:pyruvate kinase